MEHRSDDPSEPIRCISHIRSQAVEYGWQRSGPIDGLCHDSSGVQGDQDSLRVPREELKPSVPATNRGLIGCHGSRHALLEPRFDTLDVKMFVGNQAIRQAAMRTATRIASQNRDF